MSKGRPKVHWDTTSRRFSQAGSFLPEPLAELEVWDQPGVKRCQRQSRWLGCIRR